MDGQALRQPVFAIQLKGKISMNIYSHSYRAYCDDGLAFVCTIAIMNCCATRLHETVKGIGLSLCCKAV